MTQEDYTVNVRNMKFLLKYVGNKEEIAPDVLFAIFPTKYYTSVENSFGEVKNVDLELMEYVNLKSLSKELQNKIREELKLTVFNDELKLGFKGKDTLITEENCIDFGYESIEDFRKKTISTPYVSGSLTA